MNFNQLFKKTEQLVSANASAILTGVGIVGTIGTAVLAGRGAFKAAAILADVDTVLGENEEKVSLKDQIILTGAQYLPAVAMGTTTVTSIFFANRISAKRAAALAMAYGISDRSFQEYKEKVVEQLGLKKEVALRDELAQDKVTKTPFDGQTIIIGDGEVLCYDAISGRYFKSNMEKIRQAENTVNYNIIHNMYDSLSSFYDEIGLPVTAFSNDVGWNTDNILEITYTSTLTTDGRPCIAIDFKVAPVTGYAKLY